MKRFLSRYFPIIPVTIILVSVMFSHSCANTTQAPTGGPKDTIPPVLTKCSPPNGTVGVPLNGTVFSFTFDEYIVVKTASNIFLSPPQQKPPKTKLKGKTLQVTFEEDLLPDMTYCISFNGALEDNNQGNKFPGFTYVFSTGETIDTMMVTGTVRDCKTLKPIKGVTVMLYKESSDSALMKQRPFYATLTDDWGYFCIRNIKDTLYRLYAVQDGNSNKMWDFAENELLAFEDTSIVPSMYVIDTIPEVQPLDMKDTLKCQSRFSQYEMLMFKERPNKQEIVNKVRTGERSGYITFMASDAHIDSIWIGGLPSDRLISQFNIERDSLEIWINERGRLPDTLNLFVNYRKTDSLGKREPSTERVKLYMEKQGRSASSRKEIKHEDTTCMYKLTVAPETVEETGFSLEFDYPIIYENFDSLIFKSINPKQIESKASFHVEKDSLNLRRYYIKPFETLLTGYEYRLKLPHKAFRDINGYYSDSTEVKVSIPSDDKLSSLSLEFKGVGNRYIVELLDSKQTKTLRSRIMTEDCTITFPYLKKDKYSIRITNDVNGNGIIDTGSFFEHRQPERVAFLKFNGQDQLEIPEGSEIVQEIDLSELFL